MASGRKVIAKLLQAATVMTVALGLPAPASAGPCMDQFYQMAGECAQFYNDCKAQNGWWMYPWCATQYTVCDEATAAITAACLLTGNS